MLLDCLSVHSTKIFVVPLIITINLLVFDLINSGILNLL